MNYAGATKAPTQCTSVCTHTDVLWVGAQPVTRKQRPAASVTSRPVPSVSRSVGTTTRVADVKQVVPPKCCVVYPLPWPLLVGGVRCSRLWSTSQLLRPSGQQCSHSGGVCPQIQGRQCGAYVGAVEEIMCVVCVDVTEGA